MELWDRRPTDLYYANLLATEQIVVNQGGTWSGKSFAIIQAIFSMAVCNSGWTITVAGSTIPKLKEDVLRIAHELVFNNKVLAGLIKSYNVQDRIFTFKSGSLVEFKSYDTLEEAKGGKRHVLYMNEATRFGYDVFFELAIRTKIRTFIDYNPTTRFWVHDILLSQKEQYPSVKVIRSWHEHNPYLSQEQHDKIERISDPELWKVYARGLTGKLSGMVFTWGLVDDWPLEGVKEVIWGIDWGYTNDPTVVTRVAVMKDRFVVDELTYEPGLPMEVVYEIMRKHGYHTGEPVYCDHDKELILRLRRMSVTAVGAEKGPQSVYNRIMWCKQQDIRYTARSVHLQNELGRYKFMEVDGMVINKPIDAFNHAIDSATYAIYSHRNRLGINDSTENK